MYILRWRSNEINYDCLSQTGCWRMHQLEFLLGYCFGTVSYTHLTLPTIYYV